MFNVHVARAKCVTFLFRYIYIKPRVGDILNNPKQCLFLLLFCCLLSFDDVSSLISCANVLKTIGGGTEARERR